MANKIGCSVPNPKNSEQRRRLQYTKDELTDVEKRYAAALKFMEEHANTVSEQMTNMRRQLVINAQRAVSMGTEVVLNPQSGRNIQDYLARNLAVNRKHGGLGTEYTEAGWVRESKVRAQRQWRGGISKTIREMGIIEAVSRAESDITPLLKRYNLTDAARADIVTTAQELGWLPYMRQLADVNPLAILDMERQVANFSDIMVSRYGLSPKDAATVLKIGGEVAQQYHIIAKVAQEAGANFSTVENLGYFQRLMTKDAADRFNWRMKKEPGMGELFEFSNGDISTAGAVINKARSTYRFLVDDEALLDYVIRATSSRQNGGDAMAIYRKALGYSEAEAEALGISISSVLDDTRAVNNLLMGELPDDVIETLTQTGTLVKIPRLTREVAENMIRSYDLPFKGLNEIFITDFKAGLDAYTKQLETLTEQSGWTSLFFGNIIKENWGVSQRSFDADPSRYRNYVPLVGRNGVLTDDMAKRLNLTDPVLSGLPDEWKGIRSYYVHPTAANIMRSSLEIQTSPVAMAAIGETMQWLSRNFRQWATVTEGFIPRQFINSIFQVAAGGGNIMGMMTNAPLILHHYIQGKPLANAFNNTKKIYENGTMTARDVVQRMIDNGFISDYEPLSAERLSQTGRGTGKSDLAQLLVSGDFKKAYQTIERDIRWSVYAATQYGDLGRALKEAGSIPGFVTDPLIRTYQIGNNAADVVGRITAVLSTLRQSDSILPEPVHYMRSVSGNGRRFASVDDAISHWQDYFYFYDDASKMDERLRQIIPFWGFHSKNLPASIRHAIRHPSRYAAFNRVVSWANQTQMLGTDEINEGTVPEWALHTVPIFFKVPGLRDDGKDSWFSIGLSNLDPFSGAYEDFVLAPTSAAFEALNIWQDDATAEANGYRRTRGGTQERLDGSPISTNTQNRLLELLSENLYPHIGAVAELIQAGSLSASGRQETDRALNTFLGVEMSPILENLISSVIPAAATVNRMNPNQVFGQKGYYDDATETVVPDRLSFAGNVRTDNDTFGRSPLPGSDALNALGGIRAQPINILANAGTTMTDMRITVRESAKVYRKARERAMTLPPGSAQRQEAMDSLPALYTMTTMLVEDLSRFEAWAENRGMNVESAREALMKQGRQLSGLPDERTPAQMDAYEQEIRELNGVTSPDQVRVQGTVQRFDENGNEVIE